MSFCVFGQVNSSPLDLRLTGVPIDFNGIPISQALGRIGVATETGFVLFGIEVPLEKGQEPLVSAHIEGGATVRYALNQILASVPGFGFEAVGSNLVDVFPQYALNDPDDLLNLQISGLQLVNVPPSNFLSNPARFIPELEVALNHGYQKGCTIGSGLSDKAPGITIHMGPTTVRNALNAVSETSIQSARDQRGSAFGWLYLHERFPSEKAPADIWRVHGVWTVSKTSN